MVDRDRSGKQTLVPGYDVVCTVEGDLANCYSATPYKTTNGVKFKYVEASALWVSLLILTYNPLLVPSLSQLGGDRDNCPSAMG